MLRITLNLGILLLSLKRRMVLDLKENCTFCHSQMLRGMKFSQMKILIKLHQLSAIQKFLKIQRKPFLPSESTLLNIDKRSSSLAKMKRRSNQLKLTLQHKLHNKTKDFISVKDLRRSRIYNRTNSNKIPS
jgi:hypothetical protein